MQEVGAHRFFTDSQIVLQLDTGFRDLTRSFQFDFLNHPGRRHAL